MKNAKHEMQAVTNAIEMLAANEHLRQRGVAECPLSARFGFAVPITESINDARARMRAMWPALPELAKLEIRAKYRFCGRPDLYRPSL